MTDRVRPEDLVKLYLKAQNLEQITRTDEAIVLYEEAVAGRFDAAGPYDRLIAIYKERDAHADVRRIADAALSHVRTFDDKKAWYEAIRDGAEEASQKHPDRRGAEF
ncbi:MAG: hypothetical protein WD826_02215 [Actinomycetota bacterium]